MQIQDARKFSKKMMKKLHRTHVLNGIIFDLVSANNRILFIAFREGERFQLEFDANLFLDEDSIVEHIVTEWEK